MGSPTLRQGFTRGVPLRHTLSSERSRQEIGIAQLCVTERQVGPRGTAHRNTGGSSGQGGPREIQLTPEEHE